MRPNLAATAELSELVFPLYMSPKIDGIRGLVINGKLMSRSMKPLPNASLQARVKPEWEGLDMEITVGAPNAPNVMQTTSSGVMSITGDADFRFHVIDIWNQPTWRYQKRKSYIDTLDMDLDLNIVEQTLVRNLHQLETLMERFLTIGYEGSMLRNPTAHYKQGRSTKREGGLMKYKKFEDTEALVIGFQEKLHNANEAFIGELGQTKRQTLQENMVPMNTLGALVVTSPKWPETFTIGTGFDDLQRQYIWDNQAQFLGMYVKFKFFPSGMLNAPRFPVFLGWRQD